MARTNASGVTPEIAADKLHSAAIHLLRRAAKEDASSGLSAARLSALSVVVFAGPRTIGELAEEERVRSPTITGIVNGLERDGLVRREVDPNDGRVARVHATAKGKRLLERARRRRIAVLADGFRDLAAGDLALLVRAAELAEKSLRR
ncbi:MAG: MarR family transcriptional regulator [Actinomycetota bacterium]|nr:MarR family transcriptional regulator [Actinomycetota bacterium]